MQKTKKKIYWVNEPCPRLCFLQKTFQVEIIEVSFVSFYLSEDL